jgi:CRP-like cAMP-binding protein
MTIEDDIAFFERVPTLNLLGRDALRILAIGAENRYVHSGEALFRAGESADGAFVVQEGSFSLSLNPAYGGGIKVGPMTLLGELAMITETKRAMTATALEPSSVLRIPRSLFLKMLESFPQSARRLRDVLSRRSELSLGEMFAVRDSLAAQSPPVESARAEPVQVESVQVEAMQVQAVQVQTVQAEAAPAEPAENAKEESPEAEAPDAETPKPPPE